MWLLSLSILIMFLKFIHAVALTSSLRRTVNSLEFYYACRLTSKCATVSQIVTEDTRLLSQRFYYSCTAGILSFLMFSFTSKSSVSLEETGELMNLPANLLASLPSFNSGGRHYLYYDSQEKAPQYRH